MDNQIQANLIHQGVERLVALKNSEKITKIKKHVPDLFLVGGVVRDLLLGKNSDDIDLATPMLATEVLSKLESAGIRTVATGLKHGTVTAVIDGENIEITTFRAGRENESYENHTIHSDLLGRDFTINALALDCSTEELIDVGSGIYDLKAGRLVAVGDPEKRFTEDPLRIVRMVRFGEAAGRVVQEKTAQAAIALRHSLKSVAIERIKAELEGILMESAPADGFRALKKYELLEFVFPELIPTIGFEQNRFHIHDVFDHTMDVLSKTPADRILRISAIYHDIGKAYTLSTDSEGNRHFYDHEKVSEEIARKDMARLTFSGEDIDRVARIVRLHMRPFDCGPSGVRRLLRDAGDEFYRWREFKNADHPAVFDDDKLLQMKTNFDAMVETERNRVVGSFKSPLAINGDDLIKLGFKPGKKIGEILTYLKELTLEDPERNEYAALIEVVKNQYSIELEKK